jgi:hypothetical protein
MFLTRYFCLIYIFYRCPFCSYKTIHNSNLRRHVKTVHKSLAARGDNDDDDDTPRPIRVDSFVGHDDGGAVALIEHEGEGDVDIDIDDPIGVFVKTEVDCGEEELEDENDVDAEMFHGFEDDGGVAAAASIIKEESDLLEL